jgi:F1F0 ATPase subunit 2
VIEGLRLVAFLAIGVIFGLFYFGGLWLTLQRLPTSANPALLMFASFTLRTAVVVGGFVLVRGDRWQENLLWLAGFIAARMALTRLLGRAGGNAKPTVCEEPAGKSGRAQP